MTEENKIDYEYLKAELDANKWTTRSVREFLTENEVFNKMINANHLSLYEDDLNDTISSVMVFDIEELLFGRGANRQNLLETELKETEFRLNLFKKACLLLQEKFRA